jgi:uncharacterized protein YjlB
MAERKEQEKWSGEVTRTSDALDLEPHVFEAKDPKAVARSLKRSAEKSRRRKTEPFRSAMSMLTFYINRAGKSLDRSQRDVLERAKNELRLASGAIRNDHGRRRMKPDILLLTANGWVPNNSALPVLHYHRALDPSQADMAAAMETLFGRNGWPPEWRDGIYDYHHYHSTAHEALGIAEGSARLMLGGDGAHALRVVKGDVLVLPVGTGHCRIEASEDFLVVGAYPPGPQWDLCREPPSPEMMARMAALPVPATDPVTGTDGELTRLWRR